MKRLFSFIVACTLLSSLLFSGFALADDDSDIELILSNMTLEQKVGQMMAVSFRVWKEVPSEEEVTVENAEEEKPAVNITELNLEIRECLGKYHFGSAILFAENCQDAEQTLRLVAEMQAANQADHVILVHRVYSAACLDPNTSDGFSTAVFDRIIEERHAEGKTVTVVSCQLPYDAGRFPGADAMLLSYGSSVMRVVPPVAGAGSAYVPNLAAALCACFGQGEAKGQLPVDLPQLNENYRITDQILYTK